jgi:NHLM bacteriocin system ABC transporter ATP-binding protein
MSIKIISLHIPLRLLGSITIFTLSILIIQLLLYHCFTIALPMTTQLRTNSAEKLIEGNKSLSCKTPDSLWLLKSGSMAVFAIETIDGKQRGARRFLFEIKPGSLLFSIPSVATGVSQEVFTVAYEESLVVTVDLSTWFQNAVGKGNQQAIAALGKWHSLLQTTFVGTDIVLDPWNVAEPINPDSLYQQLLKLNEDFVSGLQQMSAAELTHRVKQYQARQELNGKVSEQAVQELTAVFRPREAEFFQEGMPLVIAAGAVGKVLGLQIRPPRQSEDMKRVKEPLDAIARASRTRTRRVLLAGAWWKKDCGPLLAYKADGEIPVALLVKGAGQYEVFDPELKQRVPLTLQRAEDLAPFAYMFYRSFIDKALKTMDVVRFVMYGQWRDLIVLFMMAMGSTILGMLVPQATGILIDKAIPDSNQSLLFQIALGMLAITFGKTMFEYVQGTALTRVQAFMNAHTQAAVWDRLLKVPVSFFRQYSTGDLQSRVSTINQIRQMLSGPVLQSLISGFFALFNLGLLFVYSAQMALVALAIAVLNMIVTTSFAIVSRKQMMKQSSAMGARLGFEVQLIEGISKLRVAGAEERAFATWTQRYRQQTGYTMMTSTVQDAVMLFNTAMSSMSSIAIYALAVMLMTQTQTMGSNPAMAGAAGSMTGLSIGSFLAFNVAFGTFIGGAASLSNTIIDLMDISIMWKRVVPILNEVPEVSLAKADPGRLKGGVKFDRVSFRYRKEGALTLDRVSIEAKPGEFIALVGPSGSGKSTTVRLMLGFEKPEDGTILYDGQDLAGLDVSAVRRQLGVVLQNGRLNSASIFENISVGALVTMDEVWDAARMAGFADDIENMPMGMHTVVSEGGGNLSGGQRQRLLIARALVLKPKVLIFDEATSALDNRTQAIVSQSLEQMDVTRVVIAHRLSTVLNADRIYVIAAGQVVQQGTFAELIQQDGLFSELMARQVA